MIKFYETYCDNIIVAPLVRQISWTNNIVIFSHQSSIEEKEFYIRLCIKNNYSKRELERQIASHYYERCVLSGDTKESNIPIVGEEDCNNTYNVSLNDTLIILGDVGTVLLQNVILIMRTKMRNIAHSI